MSTDKIVLDFENVKCKVVTKEKGHRKGIMKIVIKLNKAESEAYQSLISAIKPEEYSIGMFERGIFFNGLKSIQEKAEAEYNKMKGKSAEEIDAMIEEINVPIENVLDEPHLDTIVDVEPTDNSKLEG